MRTGKAPPWAGDPSGDIISILLLPELRQGAVGFLGLGDKILDALACPVPSCTATETCLECKHRMGVKDSHFLHDLEHLISPCFLSVQQEQYYLLTTQGAVRLN